MGLEVWRLTLRERLGLRAPGFTCENTGDGFPGLRLSGGIRISGWDEDQWLGLGSVVGIRISTLGIQVQRQMLGFRVEG